ncbi:amino acid adenylation domain-containing protein (plasmid) [Azospirillum oryzae]|uniref:Amino acid adenylation domain-containing protein n=1 Tax=Azospirillum oryzae TaxID=286727 RepID=A0A6N1AVV5_9PROT|nr:Pls/PosA family non-ribosomal peptide synthetase [Azospirillum oryzae]KAA0584946.1 amino acid adenylation domain-containing protein [Azospirillum oryzae]QKS54427.1 amino acid adenylation domain-containing protein [Azospirillum oryzae]GLR82403.1 peptide synthetase [Azospirillum oryzae]
MTLLTARANGPTDVSPAGQSTISAPWNATPMVPTLSGPIDPSLLRDELLSDIPQATAAAHPDRTAIVYEGRRVSYAELDARANRVARGLRSRGIGPGCFVGLWMARSLDLHVALLGILKAGAAYLPFDADAPAERVAVSLTDCAAPAILIDLVTGTKAATLAEAGADVQVLRIGDVLSDDERAFDLRADGVTPDSPAYAIYTSGSTGKPKGIVISHRNICHYLRAANSVYGITAADVAFQGASVAFDLSLEEIFVPYLAGATLWVASRQVLDEVDRLADVLNEAGVTVLDTVPTLLAMLPKDVPSLRVVILGGEACPPAVASRWCRPGRRLFNSYGPTEATVVATVAEVLPDTPVTIGRPIPNYTCYVVDEALHPVAAGTQGELLIGGPGVAQGYLGRPELTAEKFIANPYRTGAPDAFLDPLLYRSGDAVSVDADGNLRFHGRIDDQVKIRGFRLELGEIEAKLTDLPGIAQATVVLRNDNGLDRLVAFLVAQPGASLEKTAIRDALRAQLPAYMVPAHYEQVAELPRLTSGKADRKTLQAMTLTEDAGSGEQEEPRSPTEATLLDAARRVFPGQSIPLEADFFLDLGGHSLLAARFVSAVRETAGLASLTLQDVYGARTLRAMAERLDAKAPAGHGAAPADLSFDPPPLGRRLLCGLAQAAALPIILALMTVQWLGVFVSYMLLSGEDAGLLGEITTLFGVYIVINIATVVIAIAAKWLIIGRTKPGRYPLWGVYYYRWWLAQRFVALVHLKWFQGSPVMRLFLRALGAKVGADAMIGEFESGAIDLVSIGRGASTGGKVKLANAEVIGNELVIGTIEIGEDAYIGTSCVIGHDAVVGKGTELADLTALAAGTHTGDYESWDGSPARRIGTVDSAILPQEPRAGIVKRATQGLIYLVALVGLPPVALIPIFPAFYLFDRLDAWMGGVFKVNYLYYVPAIAWPTAMFLVAFTVLLIAAMRWIVLPKVEAGSYSVHSWFYVRKWVVALATEVMLETLSSLYATVYMRAWYRLMGAKIGRDAEISTNLAGRYDLVEIGEKCFIADEVVLGDEDIRRGWMHLQPVKTEARVFVGNDAVVPPGACIPTGTLIGIKSKPPTNAEMQAGDTWFGSPPIKLPVRQKFDNVSSNWTFEPSRTRRLGRAVFEAFSLSMPSMLFITFGTFAVEFFAKAILDQRWGAFAWQFLAVSVAIPMAMVLIVALVKWALMGRYAPTMKPMWSWWAMRTEAVAVLYWGLAGKVLLDHLRGTPMLPWVLRIFGTKFGKGVYMDTTDITEFDCVSVGDYCAINALSALQTHLYEDRVMKVGRVSVGTGVTIGAGATVLYDTHVGDFARLGPLTLVMKGEEIPAHGDWVGAPAEPAVHVHAAVDGQVKAAA